jgi:hypothetical protein
VRENAIKKKPKTLWQNSKKRARGTENLLPRILDCVENYVTVGEISHRLRKVWGEYRERFNGFNVTICPVPAKDDVLINVSETAPNFFSVSESSPILSNAPFLNSPPIESGASQKISFNAAENTPVKQEYIFNFDTSSETTPNIKTAPVNLPLRNESFSSSEQKTDNIFFDTVKGTAANESEGFVKIVDESASNNISFAPTGEFEFNGETSAQNFSSAQSFVENSTVHFVAKGNVRRFRADFAESACESENGLAV